MPTTGQHHGLVLVLHLSGDGPPCWHLAGDASAAETFARRSTPFLQRGTSGPGTNDELEDAVALKIMSINTGPVMDCGSC